MSTWRLAVFLLGAGILSCPVCFADNQEDYLCKDIKRPFFTVKKLLPDGARIFKTNRPQAIFSEFIMPKPPRNKRVFIIGESVAGLLAKEPGELFELVLPSWKPEIINCGMGAYNSERILMVLEEVLGYDPDLVVVLSGNNDYGGEPCVSNIEQLNFQFRRWPLYRKIQDKFHPKRDDGVRAKRFRLHEANLRQMVRFAKESKTPIVLCTLPANLVDYPPWGTAPFGMKRFTQAWVQMENGDKSSAIELFRSFLKQEPRNPFGHYFLARCLHYLDRLKEAKKHYREAVEWDSKPVRCSPSRNEYIRKVCREEGAYLADLERVFERAAPGGLVGGGYYCGWRPLVPNTV